MHPGLNKDYKFLLSRLIPRQLLSPDRIKGILDAIAGNERLPLVREAYRCMEELVQTGSFHRMAVEERSKGVMLTYVDRSRHKKITLNMTHEEWRLIGRPRPGSSGIIPSVLAGIISSLSLNGTAVSPVSRIETMLNLTGKILEGAVGYLVLLENQGLRGIRYSESIEESTLADLEKNEFYRQALYSGRICTLIRPELSRTGLNLFKVGTAPQSVILVALETGREKLGILQIHSSDPDPPDRETYSNFYLLGQGIVRFLANNKHFERMVSIDTLTQVNNRNFYESQLPLEMERASRNERCLGFLIMDIDDFKLFNDRYGHDTGDEVLKMVAGVIKKHLRKIDLLFRFGGEEFIALLPGADRDASERTAERIREVIANTSLSVDGGRQLSISITIGGCVYPVDASQESDLFRKADQALLSAKSAGKNRVQFYERE